MPYNSADLRNALETADLLRFSQILADRDPRTGKPYVDINGSCGTSLEPAIFLAVQLTSNGRLTPEELHTVIIELLGIVDANGNPVLDINIKWLSSFNLVSYLLWKLSDLGMEPSLLRDLIHRIVNLRDNLGNNLYKNPNPNYYDANSPILQAILFGDVQILHTLIDLRKADGSLVFPTTIATRFCMLEEEGRRFEKSLLDVACFGNIYEPRPSKYVPDVRVLGFLLRKKAPIPQSRYSLNILDTLLPKTLEDVLLSQYCSEQVIEIQSKAQVLSTPRIGVFADIGLASVLAAQHSNTRTEKLRNHIYALEEKYNKQRSAARALAQELLQKRLRREDEEIQRRKKEEEQRRKQEEQLRLKKTEQLAKHEQVYIAFLQKQKSDRTNEILRIPELRQNSTATSPNSPSRDLLLFALRHKSRVQAKIAAERQAGAGKYIEHQAMHATQQRRAETALYHSFNANTQNLHTDRIENAVNCAFNNLIATYGNPTKEQVTSAFEAIEALTMQSEESDFSEIAAHIQQLAKKRGYIFVARYLLSIKQPDFMKTKTIILNGLKYLREATDAEHPLTGLNHAQVITLVWQGAIDGNKIADLPNEEAKCSYLQTRRLAVLSYIAWAEICYLADRPYAPRTCDDGYRKFLLRALDRTHPDVMLAESKEVIEEMFLAIVLEYEKQELLKLPLSQQKAILLDWPNLTDSGVAHSFHKGQQTAIRELLISLKSKFGKILSLAEAQQIVSNIISDEYYYLLPRPKLHLALDELLTKVDNIIVSTTLAQAKSQLVKPDTEKLIAELKLTLLRGEESLEEEYQRLKQQLHRSKQLITPEMTKKFGHEVKLTSLIIFTFIATSAIASWKGLLRSGLHTSHDHNKFRFR